MFWIKKIFFKIGKNVDKDYSIKRKQINRTKYGDIIHNYSNAEPLNEFQSFEIIEKWKKELINNKLKIRSCKQCEKLIKSSLDKAIMLENNYIEKTDIGRQFEEGARIIYRPSPNVIFKLKNDIAKIAMGASVGCKKCTNTIIDQSLLYDKIQNAELSIKKKVSLSKR